MTKATKKPAQAGHNNPPRDLDAVEAAWDILDRDDIFARGALLIEARALVDSGHWGRWLQERDWFDESARRAMNAARLATDYFPIMREIPLPKLIVYHLTNRFTDKDGAPKPELPDIIAALDAATKSATKRLKVDYLSSVINRARQKFDYGDCPEETWNALDKIIDEEAEWVKAASSELKQRRPTVKEEAGKIVLKVHHAHVAALYAEHGTLPKMADNGWDGHEALKDLENELCVSPDRRARLFERLLAETQPLTVEVVNWIITTSDDDAKQDAKPEPEPEPEPEPAKPNDASDLEKQIAADRRYARDIVKSNRDAAQLLRAILTNQKRRDAFIDALVTALKKNADGNDADATESAEARKRMFAEESANRWSEA